MKHMNRFGKGKEQRPRIRVRILRGYGGMNAGAIISPPAGAAQILLAKKDQLGRHFAELVVDDDGPSAAPPAPPADGSPPAAPAAAAKKHAADSKGGKKK